MVFKKFDTDQAESPSTLIGQTAEAAIALAHLSDPHISCMEAIAARDLLNKRLFGFLRWKLHRGTEHSGSILSALQMDLRHTSPDHIAVTGDLTHLGLAAEYKKARQWLQSLGSPARVTAIPGNHDAYVEIRWQQTMAHWVEYMISDDRPEPTSKAEKTTRIFPSLRVRGCAAVIGVSTAHPSAPHLAVGRIGAPQMRKLEKILVRTAGSGLYRILLIHHPPVTGTVSWRKRLTDAAGLGSILKKYGAELILHGHAHRETLNFLSTPYGKVPIVGVPSISAIGRTPERRARYYLYRIKPEASSWHIRCEIRVFASEENRFIREKEKSWSTPKMTATNNE
jgi:3',5'-cyclic AMP phosphodiesterase CpdA